MQASQLDEELLEPAAVPQTRAKQPAQPQAAAGSALPSVPAGVYHSPEFLSGTLAAAALDTAGLP